MANKNQNGQLILEALQHMDGPVNLVTLSEHIANTAGVHPNDVKDSVRETLEGGVRFGFIQRIRQKYFAKPVELDAAEGRSGNAESEPQNDDSVDEGELEDRAGSRRRSRTRRSRTSRSRSSRSRRGRRGVSRRPRSRR